MLKTNKPISKYIESDEMAVIALEEEVHNSGTHLDEDEEDEFAEFVFAVTCDIDSETNIHIDHQDDLCTYCTMRVY